LRLGRVAIPHRLVGPVPGGRNGCELALVAGSAAMTDTAAGAALFEAGHGSDPRAQADQKPGFFVRWFMSTNHKDIGTLYLVFAVCAGIIGGILSGMMRAELAQPGIQFLESWSGATNADEALHFWNVLITAHGLIMIFFT
jgi:cytochrome c oxidase subunit 1